jgi:hypothetical protein
MHRKVPSFELVELLSLHFNVEGIVPCGDGQLQVTRSGIAVLGRDFPDCFQWLSWLGQLLNPLPTANAGQQLSSPSCYAIREALVAHVARPQSAM